MAACRDLSNQALAAIEQGQWQQAEGLLGNAIQTCPVDPDARRYYAEVLVKRGAVQEALAIGARKNKWVKPEWPVW